MNINDISGPTSSSSLPNLGESYEGGKEDNKNERICDDPYAPTWSEIENNSNFTASDYEYILISYLGLDQKGGNLTPQEKQEKNLLSGILQNAYQTKPSCLDEKTLNSLQEVNGTNCTEALQQITTTNLEDDPTWGWFFQIAQSQNDRFAPLLEELSQQLNFSDSYTKDITQILNALTNINTEVSGSDTTKAKNGITVNNIIYDFYNKTCYDGKTAMQLLDGLLDNLQQEISGLPDQIKQSLDPDVTKQLQSRLDTLQNIQDGLEGMKSEMDSLRQSEIGNNYLVYVDDIGNSDMYNQRKIEEDALHGYDPNDFQDDMNDLINDLTDGGVDISKDFSSSNPLDWLKGIGDALKTMGNVFVDSIKEAFGGDSDYWENVWDLISSGDEKSALGKIIDRCPDEVSKYFFKNIPASEAKKLTTEDMKKILCTDSKNYKKDVQSYIDENYPLIEGTMQHYEMQGGEQVLVDNSGDDATYNYTDLSKIEDTLIKNDKYFYLTDALVNAKTLVDTADQSAQAQEQRLELDWTQTLQTLNDLMKGYGDQLTSEAEKIRQSAQT